VAHISLKMNILKRKIFEEIIQKAKLLVKNINISNMNREIVLKSISQDKKGGTFVLIKDIGNVISNVKVPKNVIIEVLKELSI
jgi:3-dehydroquinate synthetase